MNEKTINDAEAVVKQMLERFGQTLSAGELRMVAINLVRALPGINTRHTFTSKE